MSRVRVDEEECPGVHGVVERRVERGGRMTLKLPGAQDSKVLHVLAYTAASRSIPNTRVEVDHHCDMRETGIVTVERQVIRVSLSLPAIVVVISGTVWQPFTFMAFW
ncbi:hypothetical protein LXA43DRAFT_1057818 [Ganoderma leucocontextum]|nr:hypothetical protein LXA43DRAFT_1057818 [Ganoderma leucocontextum]